MWNLGHEVMQATGDCPYVRKLFANAEKLANYFDDYMNLAGLIAGDLNDKNWADRIYSEQFESTDEFVKKKNIAAATMNNLQDEAKTRSYLKKMEEECDRASDYIKLATTVDDVLGDEGWTRALFRRRKLNAMTVSAC